MGIKDKLDLEFQTRLNAVVSNPFVIKCECGKKDQCSCPLIKDIPLSTVYYHQICTIGQIYACIYLFRYIADKVGYITNVVTVYDIVAYLSSPMDCPVKGVIEYLKQRCSVSGVDDLSSLVSYVDTNFALVLVNLKLIDYQRSIEDSVHEYITELIKRFHSSVTSGERAGFTMQIETYGLIQYSHGYEDVNEDIIRFLTIRFGACRNLWELGVDKFNNDFFQRVTGTGRTIDNILDIDGSLEIFQFFDSKLVDTIKRKCSDAIEDMPNVDNRYSVVKDELVKITRDVV